MDAESSTSRRLMAGAAIATASVLALVGCSAGASGGGGGGGGGDSVPYGSSPEEFADALADMDPVTLVLQVSASAPNVPGGDRAEAFKEYVEEYSGGTIEIEIAWGNSIASVTDSDGAVSDGRIDVGSLYALYEPSEWPANALLNDATLLKPTGIVNDLLVGTATFIEYGFREAAFAEEALAGGLHLVVPLSPSAAPMLMCAEPIRSFDDLRGKQVRVSGTVHAALFEAVGAVPVSMDLFEVYEGLQRGIIDCATSSLQPAQVAGFLEVAPYLHYSAELALPTAATGRIWGDRVAELPVAAQQILFDATYREIVTVLYDEMDIAVNSLDQVVKEFDGELIQFDRETDAALSDAKKSFLEKLTESKAFDASGIVAEVTPLTEKWEGIVAELGHEDTGSYADFVRDYTPGSIDLDPWLEALYDEVLNEYRPG